MISKTKKHIVDYEQSYIKSQFITIIIISITFSGIYSEHIQEKNTTEIISKHSNFNINTILETKKPQTLTEKISLKISMNASYVEPTEITLKPIIKLDNGTWYETDSITKTIVGLNQTLTHQFSLSLKHISDNKIILQITDSNNPNETIERDVSFDRIKTINKD